MDKIELKAICGDAISEMKKLSDESIDLIVTVIWSLKSKYFKFLSIFFCYDRLIAKIMNCFYCQGRISVHFSLDSKRNSGYNA